ncbi:hypothetical protein BIY23_01690 [Wolbachia pipientis]|uniref:Uncharacterized protein n=1 Tax=Wolbachia pipientis TaxID=955 RepID=A0A1E7QLS5_WOLPI|nr:hypothetical protein [Wolbachia pipientis]OEY87169.1 hypothetical protein BIY23_01690 [Wolbachia pipientis]
MSSTGKCYTPLYTALIHNKTAIIESLFKFGARIDILDNKLPKKWIIDDVGKYNIGTLDLLLNHGISSRDKSLML